MSQISSKVIVYVKHYLTPQGLGYVDQYWFNHVYTLMSQYEGFISFDKLKREDDCLFLTLQFMNEPTFQNWISYPGHEGLVDDLDRYRSRDYWEVQRDGDLTWQIISAKKFLSDK